MPREYLKELIIDFVSRNGPVLSARAIAHGVGRSKSPHFVGVLAEMCEDGLLVCQWGKTANGLSARYFSAQEQVPCLEI